MSFNRFNILVLALALLSSDAFARDRHFFKLQLPPPPQAGTSEYDRDFIILHQLQDTRTPEECDSASLQSHLTLENAFGPETGVLTAAEVKKAKILSMRVIAKTAVAVFYFKQIFRRDRPFNVDNTLNPCIQKPKSGDFAYPSGHSATGYALALALSRKFPEKKDIIMAQGLKIGDHRLLGGVHHPSDVQAGRELAEQIVNECMPITRAR